MNKVILLGRLTKNPELKTTASGVSVVSFTVAVNRRYAKEGQQTADFINCVAWRSTAEFISKYFTKGRMICVVGNLQTGKYEKDGQTHYTTDVVIDEAYFAESKYNSNNNNSTNSSEDDDILNSDSGFLPIPEDDDVPF